MSLASAPPTTMRYLSSTRVEISNRALTFFGGTNYLGLSFHPAVTSALKTGLDESGLGLGSSRKTTGTSPEIRQLEQQAAAFCGTQDAVVTGSGMMANIAVLEALDGDVDTWLVDELSHPSFQRFVPVTGARLVRYGHCDLADLREKLDAILPSRVGLFTDCVFPLTGRVAPLNEIADLLAARDHVLVLDEAHTLGVLGPEGRGLTRELGIGGSHVILTATLSKALGCVGGLVMGGSEVMDRIRDRSTAYSATSALPPALCRSAMAALDILQEDSYRLRRLRANCDLMRELLRDLPLAASGPNVPIFCMEGNPGSWLEQFHRRCLERGIFVPYISGYPGAPERGLLRWIVQSEHEREEVIRACAIIRSVYDAG